jgi:hypothetical protein
VVGGEISLPGGEASVTLTPLLPLGITFVNANYEVRPANANTVAWNPVLPVARRSETGRNNPRQRHFETECGSRMRNADHSKCGCR